ncbi:MAG TPA: flagellar biosynthesis protein FlhB [Gaiellaceae bacterium]|jgi:flagellar biosynthetic protein FlhB
MAGDNRTEQPTAKRRDKARREGQVARSAEVNSAVGLLAGITALAIAGPHIFRGMQQMVTRGLAQAADPDLASRSGGGTLGGWVLHSFVNAVAPIVLAAAGAGILANVAQVKLRFTPSLLKPKFSKLNPLQGMKRLFSPSSGVELLKALAKTTIVAGAAFSALWPHLSDLPGLVGIPPAVLVSQVGHLVLGVAVRVVAAMVLLAAADYAWQRRRHEKSLKMTKEEVKNEHRQSDLAPEVRGAIRRRQAEAARKRMLADVPTADVVVVNPTHFAVALRYDGSRPAPEVVAKGVDLVALSIRRVAEENDVPIVHEPPLARALYAQVDLGQMIPEDFFAAVAQVLAFVFRAAARRRRVA